MRQDVTTRTEFSNHETLSGEAIRRYDELKLKIAAIGQAAMQHSKNIKDEEGAHRYQALLARLAEDRFNLAVLGQFNRGKSSLMNAILGVDRLPTGLLPHTSVITTVTYGEQERIQVRLDGWSLPHEIPLSKLTEYVTESGNPGNRRGASSAEIQLPIEILRRGLFFIDTPGIGSAIIANTSTTRHFLSEVDSAIFVSSFDSPLGDAEIQFLKEVHRTVGKLFFVVNKADLVSASEKEAVLRYVSEHLAAEFGEGEFDLFAVSARDALGTKRESDHAALERSGLLELENTLVRFLGNEKMSQLCRRILDRLIHLMEQQRIEASLLRSMRQDSAIALLEIKSAVEAIHDRRRDLVSHIRAAIGETMIPRLRVHLDAIFADLRASVIREFGYKLCHSQSLFEASNINKFLCQVSSFIANELTTRIRTYGTLIETEIEQNSEFRL